MGFAQVFLALLPRCKFSSDANFALFCLCVFFAKFGLLIYQKLDFIQFSNIVYESDNTLAETFRMHRFFSLICL